MCFKRFLQGALTPPSRHFPRSLGTSLLWGFVGVAKRSPCACDHVEGRRAARCGSAAGSGREGERAGGERVS